MRRTRQLWLLVTLLILLFGPGEIPTRVALVGLTAVVGVAAAVIYSLINGPLRSEAEEYLP